MHKLPVILFSLCICFVFGQEKEQPIDPPGTLSLDQTLYIDKTPVTNFMFVEYLTAKDDLRKKGFTSFNEYQMSTNDTIKWLAITYPSFLLGLKDQNGKIFRRGYVEDNKYQYHPVLGISKEQAADYCKWRTEMVKYLWINNPKHIAKKKDANRINYRLPQYEELDKAKDHFAEKEKLIVAKGKNPLRFKVREKPEDFTLYKISEYTQTDTLHGENYKGTAPDSFPNDVTGFRCVCEVNAEGVPEGM